MSSSQAQLSFLEGVVLAFKLVSVAAIALSAAIRSFIRLRSTVPPFAISVIIPVTKYLRTGFTRRELVAIGMPQSTSAGIAAYCQKHHQEHTVDRLAFDTAVHWVGQHPSSPGSKLLLYVHGGGYATPIAPPQISMPISLATQVAVPTSVAFLEFSLAPGARFPTPLIQIITAISHLLTRYDPSQIILGGESSGGHLILALLSFLAHPDPALQQPTLHLTEPLAGAFLISPVVNRGVEADSYTRNAHLDLTDGSQTAASRQSWSPPSTISLPRGYLDALYAEEGWWRDVLVKGILITTGMWETMQDDCVSFGERWKKEGKDVAVTVVPCPFEVHANCILEETFGVKGAEGGSRKATEAWLRSLA